MPLNLNYKSISIFQMKPSFLAIIISLILNISVYAQNYVDYTWKFPQYGGHSLNDVKWISDQKFIAVGDQGMLLVTYDNGATWDLNQIKTLRNFKSIWVKNPQEIFVVGSFDNSGTELYKTIDGGANWTLHYENNAVGANDIHFPTDSIGYIVGNLGKVLKTTDAGDSWLDFSTASITGSLKTVWFTSPDTGFVGRTTTFGMYKTTNGGLTWSQNFGYNLTNCYTIQFINDTLGYAGGFNNRIYKTTDGGNLWLMQQNPGLSENIKSISFADSVRGMAVSSGYIYRTTNGNTWSSTFYTGNLQCGTLSPDGVAVVGNLTGGIKSSINYGSSFSESNPQAGTSTFRRIKFVNSLQGWVGGDDGKILKTSDGGNEWTLLTTSPYYSIGNDMAAISATKAIIATNEGTLITTTNGGTSFTATTLDNGNSLNAIHFPTASIGYVAGVSGKLWKTTNGGTNYSLLSTTTAQDLTEIYFPTTNTGYIVDAFTSIYKTTNAGNNWTTVNISGIGGTKQLYFVNETLGYTVNSEGDVFKTIDGGNSFTAAGSTCLQTPFDMQFINDSTGFVVGSFVNASCDVSYTINGGLTWNDLTFPYAYAGWGVFAFDTSSIFLVGQNQTILKTGDGDVITTNDFQTSNSNDDLKLYPNPSSNFINIEHSEGIARWSIVNLQGQLIANGNGNSLSVEEMPTGIYFLKVSLMNQEEINRRIQVIR